MPATTPSPAKVEHRNGNGAPQYVKCDLTAEQKLLCKQWASEVEDFDVWKWVDDAGVAGDILSVKSIVGATGFQASLTGGELSVNHRGKSLISRASSMHNAILSLMYKDVMVLQGQWLVFERTVDLDL
jgi:hypothetical protein